MADQETTIPKGWKMMTLGEVADVNNSTIDRYYSFDEIEYIDVASVEERKLTQTQKLKLENAPSRAKRIVIDNSVLISTVRPNLKHYCFIKKAKPNLIASTGFAVVNSKEEKSDPYFLYNLLTTSDYTNFLIKVADSQTSTYPAFNPSIIQNSKFAFPSYPEQRAIAAVLSSLDDKIELLREQNKTLEATAQTIFKEWFVNFNFPGATGKMIDSELGEIPERWRVGKFGDTFKIDYGRSDKKFEKDGDFPVYGAGGIVGYSRSTDYQGYQVIVGCRGTCGNITLAHEDSKITHNSLIITNEWFKPYIYLFLQIIDIKRAITGSTQPQITIGDLGNIQIYIPEDRLIKLFSENINSAFEKIKNNNSQIQTLSRLRDTLLPKLMKGEVRVKEFND